MQTLAGPYATWWDKVRGKLQDGEEKNIKKLALEWCLMEWLDMDHSLEKMLS